MNLIRSLNYLAIGARELLPVVEKHAGDWVVSSSERPATEIYTMLSYIGVSDSDIWKEVLQSLDMSNYLVEVAVEMKTTFFGYSFYTRVDGPQSIDTANALYPVVGMYTRVEDVHASDILSVVYWPSVKDNNDSRMPRLISSLESSEIDLISVRTRLQRSSMDEDAFEPILVNYLLGKYLDQMNHISEMIEFLRYLGLSDVEILDEAKKLELAVRDIVEFSEHNDGAPCGLVQAGEIVIIEQFSDSIEYLIHVSGVDEAAEVDDYHVRSRIRDPFLQPISNML